VWSDGKLREMKVKATNMSRVKNPREKKRLSLAADHRVFALEGNKTFRSAWRLKKARTNRESRRADSMALAKMLRDPLLDEISNAKVKRSLYKSAVMSLAQAIWVKNKDRRDRWNFILSRNQRVRVAMPDRN
jgi:hypothetical protein